MNSQTIPEKLLGVNWYVMMAIFGLMAMGIVILYSAGAPGGSLHPWASRQGILMIGMTATMLLVSTIDIHIWRQLSYWFYGIALVLLIAVAFFGIEVNGSKRWLDLGMTRLQPSEFMKIALILAMAQYYQSLSRAHVSSAFGIIGALSLILIPGLIVMKQPDLGTAGLTMMVGIGIMFLAGVSYKIFLAASGIFIAIIPFFWSQMHAYQRDRVLTFLEPERDPLGKAYHITQSKIAIGSGGLFGKGLFQGTQGHLKFLPERNTDFIFSTMSEELGMMGGLIVLSLYAVIIGWGLWVALSSRTHFVRLTASGLTLMIFLHVAINISMVVGLFPVVGIPLPLVSYGGSSLLTIMIALGVLFAASRGREQERL